MVKKSVVIYFIALCIMVVSGPMLMAEGELPEPMASELTLLPGSAVIKKRSADGKQIAQVNFGPKSSMEVFEYYKNKLTENNFVIEHAQPGRALIAEKPNMKAVVDLEVKRGKTMGMIALEIKKERPAHPSPKPAVSPPSSVQPGKEDDKMDMGALMGGKTKYPDEFATIIAQIPGSTVMLSRQSPKGISVMLTMKGEPIADVVSYYKTGISKNGWKKEFDETRHGSTVLGFTKKNQEISVTIRDGGDGSIISLSLDK